MKYTIHVCPKCGRHVPDAAVCLRGHSEAPTKAIEVIPRAVADELAGVAQAVAPIVRESGETGLDYALGKYREAVGGG